jgi:hypothetical protein
MPTAKHVPTTADPAAKFARREKLRIIMKQAWTWARHGARKFGGNVRQGTVKLSSKGTEKRRGSLELQTYGAALAPVISAHIANACARTARYSAAGR